MSTGSRVQFIPVNDKLDKSKRGPCFICGVPAEWIKREHKEYINPVSGALRFETTFLCNLHASKQLRSPNR